MKYRYLGNSGLAVSKVCMGTATFGREDWGCDEKSSLEILDAYVKHGGSFIDTSDQYADTISEQIIGKWLATKNRDELVIATKCFFKTSDGINSRGLSRKHIISACEASLKRLQTDYIDLYQVHESDPQTPIEETMSALDTLVHQGKVRYIGCSNYPAWKVMKSSYISQNKGFSPFISGQYLYNLLKRDIEAEVLPACKESSMGVICWGPLSGGMLTGKYRNADKPLEGTRLAARSDLSKDRYKKWYEKSIVIVEKVFEIATRHATTPAAVSLGWLLNKEGVASVIAGARKVEQIVENCKMSEQVIPDEEWFVLDELSKIKHGYPHDICETIASDWFDQIA